MIIPQQENINSIETMVNSIRTDPSVYRWFSFLIVQPAIRSKFTLDQSIAALYTELKDIVARQRMLYALLLVSLLIICFFKLHLFFLFFSVVIFLVPCIKLYQRRKRSIEQISARIILEDFKDSMLQNMTLYQITERYSQDYNIPSLVDVIYHSDKILRYTFFSILIFMGFILPRYSDMQFNITAILFYHIINAILKTNIIYRRLK